MEHLSPPLCKQSHQTEDEESEEGEALCFGLWLRIADESCLAPQLLRQPVRAARQKNKKKRGEGEGLFKGEEGEEKGLDGKR